MSICIERIIQLRHNSYKREHKLSKVKEKRGVDIYVQGSEKCKGNKELELWKLVISTNQCKPTFKKKPQQKNAGRGGEEGVEMVKELNSLGVTKWKQWKRGQTEGEKE